MTPNFCCLSSEKDFAIFSEAVEFLFDPESFIRDETVAEKFYVVFDSLPLWEFPQIVENMQLLLKKRYSSFSEFSDSIKMLILKVLLSMLKQDTKWPLELLTSLRQLPLTAGCKEVFIEFYEHQIFNNQNIELTNDGHFYCVPIEWFEHRNIYLRQKFVSFLETVHAKRPADDFSFYMRNALHLSSRDFVTLICMLNLDLDSDVLSFVRSHLLSSKLVEPKLILKHPELISSINFGDYVDENIKKSGFFESLLKFYHHGNDETKEKVAIFLCENMESKHPNVDGKYQLKLQPVNVFVKLVSVLREEGKFNNVEILSEFVRKITSSTSRYESLELQLTILVEVIRIGSSLVDEISNSFLIDCMFYAVDDCDLTSFNKARILLFRKDFRSGTIDTQWNRQHDLLRLEKNPLGCNTTKASLKDCVKKSCESVHWDMRDNVCSVIISFVGFLHLLLITHKEEFDVRHYEVAADIPELVSTLMQDSNVYVLASVCKILSNMCKDSLLQILTDEQIKSFFNHCSSFCDDVIHAAVLTTVNEFQDELKRFVMPEFYKRSFESDLCSYQTKALAAQLCSVQPSESGESTHSILLPDWLDQFLRDPNSDSALVEHIEVAIGRKERKVVDEREQKWCSFINVCEQILAESEAVNVALDCY
ncbi:uncharacterized protein LOC142348227 isoform X2 [Convolutriloba macropyga]|uniref:uncharacterized protein LOC142348227 isoform X2 n=1 Tax=Convolutriloba macropyga TaxID=536237 RepID=UPI003F51B65D